MRRDVLLGTFLDEQPTRQESIVLRDLIMLPAVTRERFVDQLYGQDPDGGPLAAMGMVYRLISSLRDKLRPDFRIVCKPAYGAPAGYSLVGLNDERLE